MSGNVACQCKIHNLKAVKLNKFKIGPSFWVQEPHIGLEAQLALDKSQLKKCAHCADLNLSDVY